MAQPATRDRRAGFGTSQNSALDPESQERDNDQGIDSLGDRVSELRKLTYGIKGEVDSQNKSLDSVGDMMTRVQFGLGGAVTRFKRVFDDPKQKRTFYLVIGAVLLIFAAYVYITRNR